MRNVRYWHKADMALAAIDVRFGSKADIRGGPALSVTFSLAPKKACLTSPLTGTFSKGLHCACATGVSQGPRWRPGTNTELKQRHFTLGLGARPAHEFRSSMRILAKAYLRLAEQADRNDQADLTYEPPPPKLNEPDAKQ